MRSFLLVALAACGAPAVMNEPITPVHVENPALQHTELLNGKVRNMRFETLGLNVAVGAAGYTLSVERTPRQGHTVVGEIWPEGTSARIEAPDGLTAVLNLHAMPYAFLVTAACDRAGTFELRVAVEGRHFSLTDAFDVVCVVPDRLKPPQQPALPARGFVTGSLDITLYAYSGESVLWTGQLEPRVDSGGPLEQIGGSSFRMVRPARDPLVHFAGLSHAVPVEIVDVPWSIAVSEPVEPVGYPGWLRLEAKAVDAQGLPLLGLARCAFTAWNGETPTEIPSASCNFIASPDGVAAVKTADRLCVRVGRMTECRALER